MEPWTVLLKPISLRLSRLYKVIIVYKRTKLIVLLRGFHSANISLNYPDMFDYVGLFSAALNVQSAGQKNSPVYQDMDKKLAVQFDKAPKLYWLGIGKDDFLYRNNAAYRADLDKKGYKYEFMETPGGHVWTCWRIYLSVFAPKLFK